MTTIKYFPEFKSEKGEWQRWHEEATEDAAINTLGTIIKAPTEIRITKQVTTETVVWSGKS